jgi:transposase
MNRSLRRRLERSLRKDRDAAYVIRVQIVLFYRDGLGTCQIAARVGRAPATVVRVLQRFRSLGENGLRDRRADNGVPKVDADALQALTEIVEASPQDFGWRRPTWTQELLALALKQVIGLEVSETTVRRMLRRLGARWGSARPIVGCPWPKQRKQRRIQQIRRSIALLGRRDVAYYEDEVDIHLNPKIGRDWMLRGQQKEVMTPGQNRKRYLAGALSVDRRSLVTVMAERKTSGLFITLLEALLRRHPDFRIHLILDNYVIHSSRQTRAFVEGTNGRIVLHFLPPYCPQENRIERLWQDLHANVTRNHRCATMDELMAEVTWWLARERRRRARLRPTSVPSPRRQAA